MIQTLVITIPALLALIECIRRGPEKAFLNVYLPVLLLLPQQYEWPISGQYHFADTAILPIALFLLFQSKLKWEWDSIDFLVIAYVGVTVIAEGMNEGYKLGSQNLFLQELPSILLPYLAAKNILRQPQFAVEAAKRVAMSLTIVAIVSVYEFRMGVDLFTPLCDAIFGLGHGALFRGGFMRIQGPYGHALTLGTMMVIGFRVARWLDWSGVWSEPLGFLPVSKIRFCEFWIAAGSVMALSVGPFLGAACGAIVISVFRAQNRKRALVSLILLISLVGPPAYRAFDDYVSVDPAAARASGDGLQEDSAYRRMLIPLYLPIVEERPAWGWGRSGFPVLDTMYSIDNAYLFTALTFGVYATILLVALMVWPAVRLTIFSLPLHPSDPRALAAFTMIGIYILNAVMDCTGSGGGTPGVLLFIVTGWTAALLSARTQEFAEIEAVPSWQRNQVGFRKVMV
jgi:hypothetical protein